MQTVAPLAAAHQRPVVAFDILRDGGSFLQVVELLNDVQEGTVLCSHGDVILETIRALWRRGLTISGEEDYRKASTWVLERDQEGFVRAHAEPPPVPPGRS
jgi:hypothetical protein